jgi:hypothetical protein
MSDDRYGDYEQVNGAVANGLLDQIEDLTKQLQWISVDERLPENGLPVLMAGSHDEPVTGYLAAARMNWYTYEDDDYVVGITHWMPIPPQDKSDKA